MLDHRTAPYAALVLRLSLAFFFIAHVYRKFALIGFDNWWNRLNRDGYPDWVVYYTLAAESADDSNRAGAAGRWRLCRASTQIAVGTRLGVEPGPGELNARR